MQQFTTTAQDLPFVPLRPLCALSVRNPNILYGMSVHTDYTNQVLYSHDPSMSPHLPTALGEMVRSRLHSL
jgi:hypothetical protein